MLGSELKEIRLTLGQTQKQFSKRIYVTQAQLSKMEGGIIKVPLFIEEKFIKVIKEEKHKSLTNKKFSKELFLKDMLTGNKVVDDLYINSSWLDIFNDKEVYVNKLDITIENIITKKIKTKSKLLNYFIKADVEFFCKRKWIK